MAMNNLPNNIGKHISNICAMYNLPRYAVETGLVTRIRPQYDNEDIRIGKQIQDFIYFSHMHHNECDDAREIIDYLCTQ